MVLNFINQSDNLDINQYQGLLEKLMRLTFEYLSSEKERKNSLNLVFINDKEMKSYNASFRGLNETTDVLSFPDGSLMDDVFHLGEILISTDVLKKQAKAYGHSEKREVSFLFVHGLLHLLGYDHQTEKDEKLMFSLQEEILNQGGVHA